MTETESQNINLSWSFFGLNGSNLVYRLDPTRRQCTRSVPVDQDGEVVPVTFGKGLFSRTRSSM